ncbi:MAG: hypothetical protein ACI4IQ_04625 [Eubacterium sp.]
MRKIKIFFAVLFIALFTFAIYGSAIFLSLESDSRLSETTISTTYPTTELTIEATTGSTTRFIDADVPYVGMLESDINSTRLGRATEVEKCKDFYKLKENHRYTEYIWKQNNKTIFKATVWYWDFKNDRAVSGYVHDVCDWRESATTKYYYTTKKQHSTTDPYNAKDYDDEEDFYEDHYDDFFDYYDAEDYYREHHDD